MHNQRTTLNTKFVRFCKVCSNSHLFLTDKQFHSYICTWNKQANFQCHVQVTSHNDQYLEFTIICIFHTHWSHSVSSPKTTVYEHLKMTANVHYCCKLVHGPRSFHSTLTSNKSIFLALCSFWSLSSTWLSSSPQQIVSYHAEWYMQSVFHSAKWPASVY